MTKPARRTNGEPRREASVDGMATDDGGASTGRHRNSSEEFQRAYNYINFIRLYIIIMRHEFLPCLFIYAYVSLYQYHCCVLSSAVLYEYYHNYI